MTRGRWIGRGEGKSRLCVDCINATIPSVCTETGIRSMVAVCGPPRPSGKNQSYCSPHMVLRVKLSRSRGELKSSRKKLPKCELCFCGDENCNGLQC